MANARSRRGAEFVPDERDLGLNGEVAEGAFFDVAGEGLDVGLNDDLEDETLLTDDEVDDDREAPDSTSDPASRRSAGSRCSPASRRSSWPSGWPRATRRPATR